MNEGVPMNNLVLAYIGDAVFELYVRNYLVSSGILKVKDLQKNAVNYVSAVAQAATLERLMNDGFLKEEEIDIVKKGRNAHSHSNKTTDIITYKKATGLETLIGHLYLNERDRLEEVMKEVLK